ncbi:MAG TPA: ABC transporter ATP-binding protein [Polyangiaceae bacterium]|nr:ABC transporter ATP-binding protein [Polyangiaceae bacterium]
MNPTELPDRQTSEESVDPLIRLSGISKVFPGDSIETLALSDVQVEIRAGEYVAIEGPSGSGKTTLLSILGLLERPSAGQYQLRGRSVAGLSARERAQIRNLEIGFIFQTFNLIGDLTVWENVELPLLYRDLSRSERSARVAAALDRVQMLHRRQHLPSQLSGGQQQRVAVARAVAGEPRIILADEPTGSLDSVSGDLVMNLLDEVHASGATLCIVTHSREYARRAHRTIRLFDGQIVDESARARV